MTAASPLPDLLARKLVLGGVQPKGRAINLRDLGFVGTVSDEARAEIERAERRATKVLTTAHLYRFGRAKIATGEGGSECRL